MACQKLPIVNYAMNQFVKFHRCVKDIQLGFIHLFENEFTFINDFNCKQYQDTTATTDFEPFFVVLYNSIAHMRSELVSLPVSSNITYNVEKYQFHDNKNSSSGWNSIDSSLLSNIGHDENRVASYVLWFDSGSVPPLSMTIYRISSRSSKLTSIDDNRKLIRKKKSTASYKKVFTVKNDVLELHFDNG